MKHDREMDDPMAEDLIGAFLDGELKADDIDRLLAQLDCDERRSRACRQAAVGSVLAGGRGHFRDISSAVREVVMGEKLTRTVATPRVVPMAPRRSAGLRSRMLVPAFGLAMAASVAAMAVVLVKPAVTGPSDQSQAQMLAAAPQVISDDPVDDAGTRAAAAQSGAAPTEWAIAVPERQRPMVAQWSSVDTPGASPQLASQASSAARDRLNAYLINHARYGGGYALSGSLGYARVAASPQQTGDNKD